jgi:type IV pilus assembly protein PilB
MHHVEAAHLPWIPLGELLVRRGLLERWQLQEALNERAESGQRIGEVIVERGWVTPAAIAHALAEQYGFPFLSLDDEELDPEVAGLLPEALARRYDALPVRFIDDDVLLVAVTDPTNVMSSDSLRVALKHNIQLAVVAEPDLNRAFTRLFRHELQLAVEEGGELEEFAGDDDEQEISDSGSAAPTINLVNAVLKRAIEDGASDVHFEPQHKQMVVRARVDGVTRHLLAIPKNMQAGVISRLKVMGGLDIAERRLPQDGRVTVRVGGVPMDLRVAIVPTTHGEQIVLRIFQRGMRRFDLSELGMSDAAAAQFARAVRQPYGGVIVCGPTGSGKTTTLYAAVDALNDDSRVLQTIEDPVEYQIDGVNQVEVNPRAGLTFARGLRAILRADPDVILVGEIRDEETAKIAAQAALTGHLVLSSLHAHSAASSIERLKNMGVEPGLLATSLNVVVGQRLARRLCMSCREPYAAPAEELSALGREFAHVELYRAKGCVECSNTGYSGRVALYEVMAIDGKLRRLMDASTEEIFSTAVAEGMTTMRDEGVRLCLEGISSFDEIRRVTGDRVS